MINHTEILNQSGSKFDLKIISFQYILTGNITVNLYNYFIYIYIYIMLYFLWFKKNTDETKAVSCHFFIPMLLLFFTLTSSE